MVLKGREGKEGNVWCEYGKKLTMEEHSLPQDWITTTIALKGV